MPSKKSEIPASTIRNLAFLISLSGLAVFSLVVQAAGPSESTDFERLDEHLRHQFSQFPVDQDICTRGNLFSSNESRLSKIYETALSKTKNAPPNYAGCWHVAEIGCGTSCQALVARHLPSGAIHWLPSTSSGAAFNHESSLIILNALSYWDESIGPIPDHLLSSWITLAVCPSGDIVTVELSAEKKFNPLDIEEKCAPQMIE